MDLEIGSLIINNILASYKRNSNNVGIILRILDVSIYNHDGQILKYIIYWTKSQTKTYISEEKALYYRKQYLRRVELT